MAATGAARTARRVHRCMYMPTPIGAQVHAARCAVLHPRLSAPHNPPGISAWLHESHCTTCDSVRMRESNRSVWAVEMAVGVWVVMETSRQGGFPVEDIAPGARRGPAAHCAACAKLAQLQAPGRDGAVWNHRVVSNPSKIHRERARGQRRLLIVHGGQPPSLLPECCGESVAHVGALRWGSLSGTPSHDLL